MKVFIEGPQLACQWTECAARSLDDLGHTTRVHFHNKRSFGQRISDRIGRSVTRSPVRPRLVARSNEALSERMSGGGWDLLLSIQGKVDAPTFARLRERNPGLRLVYWWGDILNDFDRRQVRELRDTADQFLVAYRGDLDTLRGLGFKRLYHFPFGVHPPTHASLNISAQDREKYACDVAFVGTCYENRCELIRFLDARLSSRVSVWGRSWRRCGGVAAHRAVPLAEAQKIHACAKISLNFHHPDTDDGVNMKYFEIPAAGGFQIVDWQPVMGRGDGDRGIDTFTDRDQLLALITRRLELPEERMRQAGGARARVLAQDTYAAKLEAVIARLEARPAPGTATDSA